MSRTIGGLHSAVDLYTALNTKHRPDDGDVIAREIRRLAATGLSAADVANALRVHPTVVIAALSEPFSSTPT